ncbi:MFS transporter [Candidatus Bathyarchaeota archaeon]|nr:MFS transporter [Candidatus Bathyarchaeota archaeon]
MCVVITCGIGVWPASFALAAETSSLRVRALAQGLGWFASGFATAIFGIILPYIFNPDAGNLKGKTGFVYTGFCVMGAVVAWRWVPEMKDRSAAEIDAMFEAKLEARKFKTWNRDGTE